MGDHVQVQLPLLQIYFNLTTNPGQLNLAIPSWVDAMSTGQMAVMLCGWGVKAGMARVWWQVKLCDPWYNIFSLCDKPVKGMSNIALTIY